jgi:hypothetical protein
VAVIDGSWEVKLLEPKLSDSADAHRVPLGSAVKNQNMNRSPQVTLNQVAHAGQQVCQRLTLMGKSDKLLNSLFVGASIFTPRRHNPPLEDF